MCDTSDSPENNGVPRRNFLKLAGAAAASVLLANRLSAAPSGPPPKPANVLSPDEALARLMQGNRRYVKGVSKRVDFESDRAALTAGQNPFAGILSCADSRIGPEYAFDVGRGDIFVCRGAGNFADTNNIASFEYGVAVLGVPLIMVLGHGSCGAVDSTIKAVKDGATFPGHIPSLVNHISPAVKAMLHQPGDLLNNSIRENVIMAVQDLKSAGPILNKAVAENTLKIVGGVYNLHTGEVKLVA
jgi:carbonic anhydrase